MHPSWHIGITGGIGSGKSTVTAMLQAAGAWVIDSDQLARASTGPKGQAIEQIRSVFGHDMIGADGAMRRDAMRRLIFSQPEAKRRLEAIIHPIVLQQAQALAAKAEQQGCPLIAYDIPLLTESAHWRKRLHRVIVVDCDESTQIRRVMQRNGLDQTAAAAIIASQASRRQRLSTADAVIYNGAPVTQAQLQKQVEALACRFGLMIGAKGSAQ
ncbi:MAG: dephospho-CoA kinase [Brachymonas sp.]|nr:dephospho-CoA kinase [Brachymonas sp.]